MSVNPCSFEGDAYCFAHDAYCIPGSVRPSRCLIMVYSTSRVACYETVIEFHNLGTGEVYDDCRRIGPSLPYTEVCDEREGDDLLLSDDCCRFCGIGVAVGGTEYCDSCAKEISES